MEGFGFEVCSCEVGEGSMGVWEVLDTLEAREEEGCCCVGCGAFGEGGGGYENVREGLEIFC